MILPELARCGQSSLVLMLTAVRRLSREATRQVRRADSTLTRRMDGCATWREGQQKRTQQLFYQVIPLADEALDYVERRWHAARFD